MSAKRNLLLRMLALQNNFISRGQLLTAFNAWVEDKHKSLGALLLEQKALGLEEHALLEALADRHLQRHDQDEDRSLAALGAAGAARRHLGRIADADVQASIACLRAAPAKEEERPDERVHDSLRAEQGRVDAVHLAAFVHTDRLDTVNRRSVRSG